MTEKSTDTAKKLYRDKNMKNFFVALRRLARNPIFVLTSLGVCFDCYILAFYAYLPKYIEVHFQLTAWMASLLGVMIPSIAGGIVSYVGGVISGKLKPTLDSGVTRNMIFVLTASLINVFVLIAIMFLQCPSNSFPHGFSKSTSVGFQQTCNENCSCPLNSFDPVCGSDNVWYISPCHAGCTSYANNGSSIYRDCSCVSNEPQTAKIGYCDSSCTLILSLYSIGLVCFFAINIIYNVPVTNVVLNTILAMFNSALHGILRSAMNFVSDEEVVGGGKELLRKGPKKPKADLACV
ncbi:hypothetical protein HELRODRAFT_161317 [Helobdella robusta]|uniref:Kazal-like domain-containing protein n=1 Tax=Helobdella robusta TaxID=6412 RepID=T1ERB9_HELRO|nr:hypothetical protein HELRODRAFT_161317 [Helobdella robusta]ESO02086.1 hypothetical protein HELRODRAFT_161317 [Helobdella robusta]